MVSSLVFFSEKKFNYMLNYGESVEVFFLYLWALIKEQNIKIKYN